MDCVRKITEDLLYVGGSDRRIPLFEESSASFLQWAKGGFYHV